MHLDVARLCLDCEDVHEQQTCPVCSSESFAFISRWVPPRERPAPTRTPPAPSRDAVDTYRQLIEPTDQTSSSKRWLRRGAMGLAAVSMVGWAWRRRSAANPRAEATNVSGATPTPNDPLTSDKEH